MTVVSDTNILVAGLLRKGDTRKIIFSKNFELYCPDRVHTEILKHKEEFMKKGKMTSEEFSNAMELLFENVTTIPIEEYIEFKEKAQKLTPKGHEDDWPFLALALKLDCTLWTNDKALFTQKEVKTTSTKELIKKIE